MQRRMPQATLFALICLLATGSLLIASCDSSPTPTPIVVATTTTTAVPHPQVTGTATAGVPTVTASPNIAESPTTVVQATAVTTATSVVLPGFAGPVISLAWSPDGQTLATGAGNPDLTGAPGAAGVTQTPNTSNFAIKLWQADGKLKATLAGHTGPVDALAWSPDGKTLASGSTDATLRLWALDGSLIRAIDCDKGAVFAAAWSPDGTMIATGSIANTSQNIVQIWKPDGTLLRTLSTSYSGGKFYNLQWSPDGKYLVGGATDYKIWSADGTELGHTDGCEHCTPSWGLAWSPDSTEWATGDEGSNLVFYGLQGNKLSQVQGVASINTLAWSPDGKLIAGGVGLWKPDGTHVNDFNSSMGTGVNSLAWAPDSRSFAAGSDNKIVGIFNTLGRPMAILKGHTDRVLKVAWSPDGKHLASGSQDETARIWTVETTP